MAYWLIVSHDFLGSIYNNISLLKTTNKAMVYWLIVSYDFPVSISEHEAGEIIMFLNYDIVQKVKNNIQTLLKFLVKIITILWNWQGKNLNGNFNIIFSVVLLNWFVQVNIKSFKVKIVLLISNVATVGVSVVIPASISQTCTSHEPCHIYLVMYTWSCQAKGQNIGQRDMLDMNETRTACSSNVNHSSLRFWTYYMNWANSISTARTCMSNTSCNQLKVVP